MSKSEPVDDSPGACTAATGIGLVAVAVIAIAVIAAIAVVLV